MKWLITLLLCVSFSVVASVDVRNFDSDAQEAQYRALIEEFRCPKCQNQNLASSDAVIAQDLKQKTYDLVMAGKSDGEIRSYMIERYGDFITYKPPVNRNTWLLWFFPPLVLIFILVWWLLRTKTKRASQVKSQNTPNRAGLTEEETKRLDALLKTHDKARGEKNS